MTYSVELEAGLVILAPWIGCKIYALSLESRNRRPMTYFEPRDTCALNLIRSFALYTPINDGNSQ
jgi:hypothetical protein